MGREMTMYEKRNLSRGVVKTCKELILTHPKDTFTVDDLYRDVKEEYPHIGLHTVRTSVAKLKSELGIRKVGTIKPPDGGLKGRRAVYTLKDLRVRKPEVLESSMEVHPEPPPPLTSEGIMTSAQVGQAIIEAIQGMKQRISEQEQRILSLENNIRNLQSTHSHEVRRLNAQVSEKQAIIVNLRKRLDNQAGGMTFSMSDVAQFRKEVR